MKYFLQSSLSYWVMCWTICNSKVQFCFKDWIRYHLQHKVKNIFLMKSTFLKNDWFIHMQTMKLKLKKRSFDWDKNHVPEKVSIFSFSINNKLFWFALRVSNVLFVWHCLFFSVLPELWFWLFLRFSDWSTYTLDCATITLGKGIIDAF